MNMQKNLGGKAVEQVKMYSGTTVPKVKNIYIFKKKKKKRKKERKNQF